MKFSLYYIKQNSGKYEALELEIDEAICWQPISSIAALTEELRSMYTRDLQSLLFKEDTKNCSLYHYYDRDCHIITHLMTIEYPDIETFLKNFIKDIKINYPELLL